MKRAREGQVDLLRSDKHTCPTTPGGERGGLWNSEMRFRGAEERTCAHAIKSPADPPCPRA